MITLDEARARGIALPADDDVAQDIIDEQEAWLARRIGPLEGDRTETFYVGVMAAQGKLGLRRFTDAVVLTDAGVTVNTDLYRLVDHGAGVELLYVAPFPWWTGPYVTAAYEPNDADEVRRALFDLVAIAAQPASAMLSETIGAYQYTRASVGSPAQARAIIVSSLLPKRSPLATLYAVSRPIRPGDPVINRPELPL
jgi:hypothetical protein